MFGSMLSERQNLRIIRLFLGFLTGTLLWVIWQTSAVTAPNDESLQYAKFLANLPPGWIDFFRPWTQQDYIDIFHWAPPSTKQWWTLGKVMTTDAAIVQTWIGFLPLACLLSVLFSVLKPIHRFIAWATALCLVAGVVLYCHKSFNYKLPFAPSFVLLSSLYLCGSIIYLETEKIQRRRATLQRLLITRQSYQKHSSLDRPQAMHGVSDGRDEITDIADIERGFHEMAADLAEYVRKEQSMYENAKDIICSLDAQRIFLRANQAVDSTLGYAVGDLVGKAVDDLIASANRDKAIAAIDEVIKSKGTSDFETTITCRDGSSKILRWNAHWAETDQALFCVLHDVTGVKLLERAKQDFVAIVSHDLSSPLMAVQATLETFEGNPYASDQDHVYGKLTARGLEAVQRSQRNLKYLLQFIEQILSIEKMESGRFELDRSIAPVYESMERAKQLVGYLAENLSVNIVIEETDARCYVDADRLIQVLVNLMTNAIKHAPTNTEVRLSAIQHEQFVEFRLSDKGKGIPEAMTEAIFERFQQVSVDDWKVKRGSGLGLAICKQIVESHGGKIGVDSVEGKGSTFWFRIPTSEGSTS